MNPMGPESFWPRGKTTGLALLVLAVILLLTTACRSSSLHYYAARDLDHQKVRRVAVLPLFNRTGFSEASRISTSAYIAQMVTKTDYQVEFPGNIQNFLVRERIIIRDKIDLSTIELMHKRLGVDAVVLGEVIEFFGPAGETGASDTPLVHLSVRMVDAETGRILFMASHFRTGDDYMKIIGIGKIRSTTALAQKVAGEIVDKMP